MNKVLSYTASVKQYVGPHIYHYEICKYYMKAEISIKMFNNRKLMIN